MSTATNNMSSTLPTPPPFQQWQQFFPNGNAYGYDQTELNQILSGVSDNQKVFSSNN